MRVYFVYSETFLYFVVTGDRWGDSVMQWLGRSTCDSEVVSSIPGRVAILVTALGKLLTPMCLCHLAV